MQMLHDLRFLGPLDFVLFLMLEVVLDHMPEVFQLLSGKQFAANASSTSGRTFFNLAQVTL